MMQRMIHVLHCCAIKHRERVSNMMRTEYFSKQLLRSQRFQKESNILIVLLKAYEGNLLILSTMQENIYQLKYRISTLENEKQRHAIEICQRKIQQHMKQFNDLLEENYRCYIYRFYCLADGEITQRKCYTALIEETKGTVLLIRKELCVLMNEVANDIYLLDRYRHSYQSMKRIFLSYDDKGKREEKRLYERMVKEKEYDDQIIGKVRKTLAWNQKRLQEMDRRLRSVLMKAERIYDEKKEEWTMGKKRERIK